MRRCSLMVAVIVILVSLTACGRTKEKAYDVSTIVVGENGVIQEYIVETFDEDIYDRKELSALIESEISAYKNRITSSNVKVDGGEARVLLTYNTAEDYADFNNELFFVGMFRNAIQAGYEFSLPFVSVKDGSEVSVLKLPGMQNEKICIWESPHEIQLDGHILFFSQGVELINDHCAAIREGTYGYVIYE